MIKMLIVDDEIASINTIKKLLNFSEMGIELIGEAANGVEAMKILNGPQKPDIVISDMEMPIMNGVMLLKYISDCFPEICIIISSGYYEFDYTHAAIRARAKDYILKPIIRSELVDAVEKCCKEINERSKVSTSLTPDRIDISVETYRQILLFAENIKSSMEYDTTSYMDVQLSELVNYSEQMDKAECFARAAYKIVIEAVTQYCITEQFLLFEMEPIPENAEISTEDIYAKLKCYLHEQHRIILEAKGNNEMSSMFDQIMEYIRDNYRSNIKLETIANEFHFNKEYLATIFKRKYNSTIGEFVLMLKIQDAKRQLEYTRNSIEKIADSLGYNDTNYFIRQFKKSTGVSPGAYRKHKPTE